MNKIQSRINIIFVELKSLDKEINSCIDTIKNYLNTNNSNDHKINTIKLEMKCIKIYMKSKYELMNKLYILEEILKDQ